MKSFNPKSEILALDFDGVVIDSIEECLVVGYNALAIQQQRTDRIQSITDLDSGMVLEFRRIRNFIRHGQDYVFIHLALQQKADIQSQSDFDRYLEVNDSLNAEFRNLFYKERARFLADEPETWLALNPMFAGMAEFIQAFQPKEHLFIITTKLKENVEAIFNGNNFEFKRDNIYSADQKLSKTQIIEQLVRENNIKPTAFHFIDDQVDTLIKTKSTDINLYLAEWGYNNPEQVEKSHRENIRVIDLQDFYTIFLKAQ